MDCIGACVGRGDDGGGACRKGVGRGYGVGCFGGCGGCGLGIVGFGASGAFVGRYPGGGVDSGGQFFDSGRGAALDCGGGAVRLGRVGLEGDETGGFGGEGVGVVGGQVAGARDDDDGSVGAYQVHEFKDVVVEDADAAVAGAMADGPGSAGAVEADARDDADKARSVLSFDGRGDAVIVGEKPVGTVVDSFYAEKALGRTSQGPSEGAIQRQQSQRQRPRRLSYREQQEMASLEREMEALNAEKAEIEALLAGNVSDYEAISKASARYSQLKEELDVKELRWLELSEIA